MARRRASDLSIRDAQAAPRAGFASRSAICATATKRLCDRADSGLRRLPAPTKDGTLRGLWRRRSMLDHSDGSLFSGSTAEQPANRTADAGGPQGNVKHSYVHASPCLSRRAPTSGGRRHQRLTADLAADLECRGQPIRLRGSDAPTAISTGAAGAGNNRRRRGGAFSTRSGSAATVDYTRGQTDAGANRIGSARSGPFRRRARHRCRRGGLISAADLGDGQQASAQSRKSKAGRAARSALGR